MATDASSGLQAELEEWFEKIGSTELIPTNYRHQCKEIQVCDVQHSINKMLVDKQTLRELWHEDECEKLHGIFAKCTTCGEKLMPEELSYVFEETENG